MSSPDNKYHIDADGNVFRVNDDGSFTSIGNAEKMSGNARPEDLVSFGTESAAVADPTAKPGKKPGSPQKAYTDKKKSSAPLEKAGRKTSLIICVIALLLAGGGVAAWLLFPGSAPQTPVRVETQPAASVASSAPDSDPNEMSTPASTAKKETASTAGESALSQTETQRAVSSAPAPENTPTEEKATPTYEAPEDNKIYDAVNVQAEYPGGDAALLRWLRAQGSGTVAADGTVLNGYAQVEFVIEKDGRVSNAHLIYSDNPAVNETAVRIVNNMPRWASPAMVRNRPVRSKMTVSLSFH